MRRISAATQSNYVKARRRSYDTHERDKSLYKNGLHHAGVKAIEQGGLSATGRA